MKLSEILGWEKKKAIPFKHVPEHCSYCTAAWNDSLTSCDREIDREALAKELYKEFCDGMSWENTSEPTKIIFRGYAVGIISTMPTWLKRVEG